MAVRGEVGRLPRARVRARRRVAARLAERERPHAAVRAGGEGDREGDEEPARRPRRRDLRARRAGTRELLRDAAGERPARLLRVRPARVGRRAARRPAARGAPQPARAAARPPQPDGPSLGELRRRRRARGGRGGSGSRRDHGQARRLAVLPGQAHARLAEDQDARPPGVRRRRVHRRVGAPRRLVRLARARGAGRGRPPLRRQRRHRVRRRGDPAAVEADEAAAARHVSAERRPEDAPRPQGRRDVDRAAARGGGRVQRVDAPDEPRDTVSQALFEAPLPSAVRDGKRELRLSNLDKIFWPDGDITKGDLLRYYRAVAPVLVPHLKDRPFTMRRYPDGVYGEAFFQKDAPSHMPDWIPTFRALVSTRERSRAKKWVSFPLVNDELALLWMVNMGCIDMNTWYSRVDKADRPDFVLFDLDPTPEVPWGQVVEVALILRELLDRLGLQSFPKTSGGKGFHVLVPLDRRSTFEDTRSFSEMVAGAIARAHPTLATTEWSKARRRGVLIDANQNGEGKTIASVYSVRPKQGAPVSTPLRWDEVDDKLNPSIYSMPVVLERIEQFGDLYAPLPTTRQSLSKALAALG